MTHVHPTSGTSATATNAVPPSSRRGLRIVFWLLLFAFLAWDFNHSAPVNLRLELPPIAAGSGQSSIGGHCSMPD